MKRIIQKIVGAALLLALPLSFTSCEDILGSWDKPIPSTPEVTLFKAILDSGSSMNVKFKVGDENFSVTFKKVGDKYTVQSDNPVDLESYKLDYKDGYLIMTYIQEDPQSQIFFNPIDETYYIINDLGRDLKFDGTVNVNGTDLTVTNACPKKAQIDIAADPTPFFVSYKEGETWQSVIDRYAISQFPELFTKNGTFVSVKQGTSQGDLKNNDNTTKTNVTDDISDASSYKLAMGAIYVIG